jgi:cation diffusion facilitator CzcD-associated flavoprotein CzcO
VSRRHLEKQVPDPGLRARLTPDYQMGCKRVLPSSAFYPALQRPQVDLVTEGISCLTRGGIRDIEGTERAADTIVFATGFDVRANLRQIEIIGSGGASLEAIWDREGLNAHLGIMVSGFPNLFLLLGPNTGLGHSSVVFMIEAQVAFVLRALRLLDESGGRQIDVHAGAQRRSVRAVQKRLAGTVWQSGCRSWYLDESGRNDTIWPRSTVHYWLAVRLMRRRDYSLTGG